MRWNRRLAPIMHCPVTDTPENIACEKPSTPPPAGINVPPPRTKLLFLIHNFFSRCIFTCFGLKLYTPSRRADRIGNAYRRSDFSFLPRRSVGRTIVARAKRHHPAHCCVLNQDQGSILTFQTQILIRSASYVNLCFSDSSLRKQRNAPRLQLLLKIRIVENRRLLKEGERYMSHSSVQCEGIRATTIELSWIELSRLNRKNGSGGHSGARKRRTKGGLAETAAFFSSTYAESRLVNVSVLTWTAVSRSLGSGWQIQKNCFARLLTHKTKLFSAFETGLDILVLFTGFLIKERYLQCNYRLGVAVGTIESDESANAG